jgi:hypothetical protein
MKQQFKGIVATAIILVSLFNANAQKAIEQKNVNASVVINKPAAEVWKVFATIDGLEKVIPSLLSETHIEGEGKVKAGCVRYCKSPQGNVTREKIVKLDQQGMFYSYEFVEGVPAKMTNSFKVIPLGESTSKLVWNSDYTFMQNPMMTEEQLFAFVNISGQKIVDEAKSYFDK